MNSDYSAYTASRGAFILKNGVKIAETATAGGKIEKEGPLGELLDVYCDSDDLHTGTFEKAEAETRETFSRIRENTRRLMKYAEDITDLAAETLPPSVVPQSHA